MNKKKKSITVYFNGATAFVTILYYIEHNYCYNISKKSLTAYNLLSLYKKNRKPHIRINNKFI